MPRAHEAIARAVLDSPAFAAGLEAIAGKAGMAPDAARRHAEAALLELVCDHTAVSGFLLDRAVGGLYRRAWTYDVDWTALERLRRDHPDTSMVFLPSHRSYADAFVLMRALLSRRLPPTYIVGGDNLKFFPLGAIGKRSGIIFIRRSFKDDDIYKLALRRYMHHLIVSGANLEWYMEGGRSRTGKLRPPQYGLLRYLVDALQEAPGRDVLLVPVSITYDQLQEVGAMAAEEAGGTKVKEGLGWLANYVRRQGDRVGQAHVRFGEPLSLRDTQAPGDAGAARWTLDKVAFEVFHRINRATPVNATALVTLGLLGVETRSLALREVHAVLQPLLDYAEARGLPTAALEGLRRPEGVEEVLAALVRSGIVGRSGTGPDAVFHIEPGQHGVAAYYRNSAIHWFVTRAILELGVMVATRAGDGDALARGLGAARAWRDLLKFEFFFSEKAEFEEEIAAEARLLHPGISMMVSGRALPPSVLEGSTFLVAHRILTPFLEAYRVLAERLAALPPDKAVDRKVLLAECLSAFRESAQQGQLRHPESASREILANGLALAANRGLLGPGDAGLQERRQALAAELAEAVGALGAIGELDARLRLGIPAPR